MTHNAHTRRNLSYDFFPPVILCIASFFFSSCTPCPRVAYVDFNRALNETQQGMRAKSDLKQIFNARQRELEQRQQTLKLLEQDIRGGRADWNESVMKTKRDFYMKALMELQERFKTYQSDLKLREEEHLKGIADRMKNIVRDIGEESELTFIFEINEGGAFHVDKSLDITDEVIRRYDKLHPAFELSRPE